MTLQKEVLHEKEGKRALNAFELIYTTAGASPERAGKHLFQFLRFTSGKEKVSFMDLYAVFSLLAKQAGCKPMPYSQFALCLKKFVVMIRKPLRSRLALHSRTAAAPAAQRTACTATLCVQNPCTATLCKRSGVGFVRVRKARFASSAHVTKVSNLLW